MITEKTYDDHGWVASDRRPYFNDDPVDTSLSGNSTGLINSYTNYAYDQAGRVTTETLMSNLTVRFSTTTAYGGDRVSVTPPTGGTATTTVSNARGQVTRMLQYLAATPTGPADATVYGYSKRGELTKITDSSGTIWNKTYNIRGLLLNDSDPDKGTTTYTYNALDLQVTSTDARAVKLWSKYDKLDRKTELRDDNSSGTLRSKWVYDTVRPGSLTSSTRYDGANAYVNKVTAFDAAGQPTSSRVVIPAAEGPLAGSYITGAEYNVDGSVKKITQPKVDDPTAEELTYTYDALGNPITLTGFTTLVTSTSYSSLGLLNLRNLGTTPGAGVADTRDYDQATNHTTSRKVTLQTSPAITRMDLRYDYDDAGNVTRLNDVAAGDINQDSASTWRQCFKYDYLRRMTEAYTSSGNACAAPAATTTNLGTLAPYWDAYTFAKSGNRTNVVSVRKPAASLVTTTHASAFPAATDPRPHAVTSTAETGGSTGNESYVYDAAGNLSERSTSASVGKTIVFDREGHQKTVTDIATGDVTEYLYDADGNRLIERDAGDASTTLFLASGEVKSKAGARTTTRTYTLGGEAIATRDATGVKLMVTDNNGTPLLSVDGVTQAFEKRRNSPYGEVLQAPGSWPSDRGYLNKVTDTTGTTHLGAREYDPVGGRFISVDPILNPLDPQQMNGYAYAGSSPVTSSDPSGLYANNGDFQEHPNVGGGSGKDTAGGPGSSTGGDPGREKNYTGPSKGNGNSNSNSKDQNTAGAYHYAGKTSMGHDRYMQDPPLGPCKTDKCLRDLMKSGKCNTSACQSQWGWLMFIGSIERPNPVVIYPEALGVGLSLFGSGMGSLAVNSASKFGNLAHAADGIAPYSTQRLITAGQGGAIQAHHLIEKRFADVMGQSIRDMPSIVVTRGEHQVFTNAWRAEIPYGSRNVMPSQVNDAARRIYADYPEILQGLGLR